MAADTLLAFSALAAPTASASPAPPSPAPPMAASSRPASPASAGAGACGSAGGNSVPSQPAQAAADGSAAANGSGASGSDPACANSPGKPDSGQPGNPTRDSRAARRTAPASGPSQASAPQTPAQPATSADDFPATLAQSLAAAPADGAKTANVGTAKGSVEHGTGESGSSPGKHSAADDPVSAALALLENALSGALAGVLTGVPTPANPGADATSASRTSSRDGRIGSGVASTLATLLCRNLATDSSAIGASSAATAGSPTAASPAATATAAAAALTAAQLTSGSAVASQHAKPDPTTMVVSSPVGSSAWTDELGAKVTWMAHQGIESASLQLSPEHLGPLQVTISVHDGQASVWFGAAQPDTRTALQQSLPQLRQLFASQGLTLADAGVSRESPRGHARQTPGRTAAAVSGVTAVARDTSAGHTAVTGGLGLVDTYV
jgi:flagellar hook-length control protein FliK